MLMLVIDRVKTRLTGSAVPSDDELEEFIDGITDRLRLMVRTERLPPVADSIVVDAAVKAVNRRYYEGVSSESEGQTGSITTAFYENLLAEYADEIQALREMVSEDGKSLTSKVRFV